MNHCLLWVSGYPLEKIPYRLTWCQGNFREVDGVLRTTTWVFCKRRWLSACLPELVIEDFDTSSVHRYGAFSSQCDEPRWHQRSVAIHTLSINLCSNIIYSQSNLLLFTDMWLGQELVGKRWKSIQVWVVSMCSLISWGKKGHCKRNIRTRLGLLWISGRRRIYQALVMMMTVWGNQCPRFDEKLYFTSNLSTSCTQICAYLLFLWKGICPEYLVQHEDEEIRLACIFNLGSKKWVSFPY